MSYFAFYLKEALSVAQGTGPWSIVSQCVIQGAQSDAQREQAKVQIPQMAIAPDSEDLKDISLGIPIKYPDSFIGIHVGHPVDDLALTRPDLVLSGSPNGNRSVASETDESAAPPDALDKKFSSVDFGPYLAKMRKDIQAKWSPPKGYEDRHILTTFSISYDGYISDPEILEGSGIDPVDESALEALRSVSPLDPLPKGLPKSVQVRYQFDGRTKPE
jgi:TonB family protein